LDPETLRCLSIGDMTTVKRDYGYGSNAFHRHQQMRELAEKARVVVKLGCEVGNVQSKEGILILKDGTSVRKDLLIIANGVSVSAGSQWSPYRH
jgi:hypothetical protein